YGFLPATNPSVHEGSWAELITVPEDDFLAAKPRELDMASAGAVPLAAITALAAREALAPTRDETVLVIGATGGVGTFFVPLGAAGEGPQRFNLVAQPTPGNLQRVAELLDSGAFRVHIQRSYELAQGAEALQALSGSHKRGKLSLAIA